MAVGLSTALPLPAHHYLPTHYLTIFYQWCRAQTVLLFITWNQSRIWFVHVDNSNGMPLTTCCRCPFFILIARLTWIHHCMPPAHYDYAQRCHGRLYLFLPLPVPTITATACLRALRAVTTRVFTSLSHDLLSPHSLLCYVLSSMCLPRNNTDAVLLLAGSAAVRRFVLVVG